MGKREMPFLPLSLSFPDHFPVPLSLWSLPVLLCISLFLVALALVKEL